jgi:DNA-binding SARP family transcriptional activator
VLAGAVGGERPRPVRSRGRMRFQILGPLQVVGDDGRELALGGRMPRAVLVLLLLRANEVVSSDQLVEELWAGEPPASGAKGLHVHVSRLRRALAAGQSAPDGERLLTTPGGYVLRVGPEELDGQRCERLIGEGRSLLKAGRPDQALAALSSARRSSSPSTCASRPSSI